MRYPPNTGDFAKEIVADLQGEFRGSASIDDLHEWFGDDRERLWRTLKRLALSGLITKINGRYYASSAIQQGKAA